MKYFLIFLGLIGFILILILFFQMLTGSSMSVPFFTKYIQIHVYVASIVTLSYLSGIFLTLGITKFTSSNNLDNDFDL